jgi:hypothetical protein
MLGQASEQISGAGLHSPNNHNLTGFVISFHYYRCLKVLLRF